MRQDTSRQGEWFSAPACCACQKAAPSPAPCAGVTAVPAPSPISGFKARGHRCPAGAAGTPWPPGIATSRSCHPWHGRASSSLHRLRCLHSEVAAGGGRDTPHPSIPPVLPASPRSFSSMGLHLVTSSAQLLAGTRARGQTPSMLTASPSQGTPTARPAGDMQGPPVGLSASGLVFFKVELSISTHLSQICSIQCQRSHEQFPGVLKGSVLILLP